MAIINLDLKEKIPSILRWKLKYNLGLKDETARRLAFKTYWWLCPRLRCPNKKLGKQLKKDGVLELGQLSPPQDVLDIVDEQCASNWNIGTSQGRLIEHHRELKASESIAYLHHRSFCSKVNQEQLIGWVDNNFGDALRSYYGSHYRILSLGVYRTKMTPKLHDKSSQQWHTDNHPPGLLKGFTYLSDVQDEDGPFSTIVGSNRNRKLLCQSDAAHRFNEQSIAPFKHQIKRVTGPKGTSFIGNANAVHCGPPPQRRDRTVLNLYFLPSMRTPLEHYRRYGFVTALSGPDRIHEPIWNVERHKRQRSM